MMFYPMFYFNPAYILMSIGVVIPTAASAKLNSTYQHYSAVRSMCDMASTDAVKRLLASQRIYDVIVHRVPDSLTDHYDPRSKTVNLSDAVCNSTSTITIGVATHEYGRAMQDTNDYSPLGVRAALMPAANLGSQLCQPLIIIRLLLRRSSILLNLGILSFCLAVLLQLVTLSVEYDAPHRAVTLLGSTGILAGQEVGQTRKVLNAAALTYAVAATASILRLLRLLISFDNRRND